MGQQLFATREDAKEHKKKYPDVNKDKVIVKEKQGKETFFKLVTPKTSAREEVNKKLPTRKPPIPKVKEILPKDSKVKSYDVDITTSLEGMRDWPNKAGGGYVKKYAYGGGVRKAKFMDS